MVRVIQRKAWADLRSQPLRTALIFVVAFGAAFTMMTALTVQRTAADPFERVHDQANGAHVWFEGSSGVLEPIATMSGVESATGMFLQVRGTLVGALSPVGLKFWPAGPDDAELGPALLREGRWPEVGSTGAVIDNDLARRIGAGIGDTMDVSSASTATQLEVVGIGALIADSPGAEPVPVFVSTETVLLLAGGKNIRTPSQTVFLSFSRSS